MSNKHVLHYGRFSCVVEYDTYHKRYSGRSIVMAKEMGLDYSSFFQLNASGVTLEDAQANFNARVPVDLARYKEYLLTEYGCVDGWRGAFD